MDQAKPGFSAMLNSGNLIFTKVQPDIRIELHRKEIYKLNGISIFSEYSITEFNAGTPEPELPK